MSILCRPGRRKRLLYFAAALIVLTSLTSSQAQQTATLPAPSKSVSSLQQLWRMSMIGTDVPKARAAFQEFQAVVAEDKTLSLGLRTLIKGLSFSPGKNVKWGMPDGSLSAGIGVLLILSLPEARTGGTPEVVRQVRYQLQGQVAKYFDYGFLQRSYDSYLSKQNAVSRPRGRHYPSQVPEAEVSELTKLRRIFKDTGDTEWEIKTLKWHLGTMGTYDLLTPEATAIWTRLSQLESGLAGELDIFLAQASTWKEVAAPKEPEDEESEDEAPTATDKSKVPATAAIGRNAGPVEAAVKSMLAMRMPWEARLFVDHIEKKQGAKRPELQAEIRDQWDKDIRAASSRWLTIVGRPLFIGRIKVTPETTLDQYLAAMVERDKPKK